MTQNWDTACVAFKTSHSVVAWEEDKEEAATLRKLHHQQKARKVTAETLFFPQVFDDLQKMLTITEENNKQSESSVAKASVLASSPIMQFTLGLCVALTTVGMGMYVL